MTRLILTKWILYWFHLSDEPERVYFPCEWVPVVTYDGLCPKEMEKLTIPQLKDELIRMNVRSNIEYEILIIFKLSTSGTKSELIGRIRSSVRGITIWNSPVMICHYFILYSISSFKKAFVNLKASVILITGVFTWFIWIFIRSQESLQLVNYSRNTSISNCPWFLLVCIQIRRIDILVWLVDWIRYRFLDRFRNWIAYICFIPWPLSS